MTLFIYSFYPMLETVTVGRSSSVWSILVSVRPGGHSSIWTWPLGAQGTVFLLGVGDKEKALKGSQVLGPWPLYFQLVW